MKFYILNNYPEYVETLIMFNEQVAKKARDIQAKDYQRKRIFQLSKATLPNQLS
jgi:hypothetical protein